MVEEAAGIAEERPSAIGEERAPPLGVDAGVRQRREQPPNAAHEVGDSERCRMTGIADHHIDPLR